MKTFVCLISTLAVAIFIASGLDARAQQPVVTHKAVITTTVGNVTIELYGQDAPKTVANFVGLAEKGFYNGIVFHKVVSNFIVQAGDPATKDSTTPRSEWGKAGESIYGGPFADELDPISPSYKRGYVEGTLAMANRGPNTNMSQFFILLKDNDKMKKMFTIFGKVSDGMDIVHKIETVGKKTIVRIVSVAVTKTEK